MSKEEFLNGLKQALQGEVPASVIQENLRYYSQYISEETGRGTPEREVLEAIGDPRLIARTIIDSTVGVDGAGQGTWSAYESTYDEQGSPAYEKAGGRQSGSFHYYDLNKWYWKLLLGVIVVGVLFLVLAIVGGIFSLLVPLLPILIIVYIIMVLTRGSRR